MPDHVSLAITHAPFWAPFFQGSWHLVHTSSPKIPFFRATRKEISPPRSRAFLGANVFRFMSLSLIPIRHESGKLGYITMRISRLVRALRIRTASFSFTYALSLHTKMRRTLLTFISVVLGAVHAFNQTTSTTLHQRTYFYVAGNYVPQGNSSIMQGSIYVERLTPQHVTQPLPLLIIHGHGQSVTDSIHGFC